MKRSLVAVFVKFVCAVVVLGIIIVVPYFIGNVSKNRKDENKDDAEAAYIEDESDDTAADTKNVSKSEKKIDDEYFYNWLLDNGELVGGTELKYSETVNGDVFEISYDKDCYSASSIVVSCSFGEKIEGYNVDISMPLRGKYSGFFHCGYFDDTKTGKLIQYTYKRKSFCSNSPIESDGGNSYLDGDTYFGGGEVLVAGVGKTFREADPISDEKRAIMVGAGEISPNYNAEIAHDALCKLLDWLESSVCPAADCALSDLGFEKYSSFK